ncbi:metallophosphoesterase [Sphingopyxis sp. 2PD]|uniref:metallophosphoesterase n=1 Tax=Sphingopyxis sp. 2PD TaxID=2502196 RepID=UPI0010F75C1B|nr:metallophosphoesterase [Sphingopyxis sp. 2PD]
MGIFARFRRSGKGAGLKVPTVPSGLLLYAVGDIHGRDDLFAELLDRIDADRRSHDHDECILILLGDLVDRGPDSNKVIDRALAAAPRFDRFHHLIGNHEECMIQALTGDARALRYFVKIGGDATIRSYMCDDPKYDAASYEELASIFSQVVPATHTEFLDRGEDLVAYGDYVFVHAGIRDEIPIDRQKVSDLRWIREDFLRSNASRDVVVVHGHTISNNVEEQPHRIGIDTGAYVSGVLTAVGLSADRRWFLQTGI